MSEILYAASPYLMLGTLVGLAASTVGFAVDRVRRIEEAEAREAARVALESVPRVPDPLVEAITGEIEVVHACPHLSTLDRLDGLRCSECR